MRTIHGALVMVTLLSTPSCSLFASSTETVAIRASEPNAEILVNGNLIGVGTATAELKRNKTHQVIARVGDRVGTASIGYRVSTTGILDIIGGFFFLFPWLGLLGPGFHELDSDGVTVVVPPARTSG